MSKGKIGIVGLGLIGGSIEKCLSEQGYEILTVSKSQNRKHELEDLHDCDLVFLCGSQLDIQRKLQEIAFVIFKSSDKGQKPPSERAFARTLITDVGSTKAAIVNKAKELGLNNFIGGHPMAGTEKAGYEASFKDLFKGATWILTPDSSHNEAKDYLRSVIKELGAESVVEMDPHTHDKSVAVISHLPLLLSLGLGSILNEYPAADKVIGPGFKGMVRLARGNVEFSRDLLVLNRKNIVEVLENFKGHLDSLVNMPAEKLLEEIETTKNILDTLTEENVYR